MKKWLVAFVLLMIIGAPMYTEASTLADGKYSLPYQVNEGGGDSASYGNDYFVKPATLIKKEGQMYVQFTLKQSSWITALSGNEGGNKVLSTDTAADKRVVQFNISEPFGRTGAKIKVDIAELSYHHEYNIDFVWFGEQATLIESYEKPVEEAKPVEQPAEAKPVEATPTPVKEEPKPQVAAQAATPSPAAETKPQMTEATQKPAQVEPKEQETKKEADEVKETKEVAEQTETKAATRVEQADVATTEEIEQQVTTEAAEQAPAAETKSASVASETAAPATQTEDSSSNATLGLIVLAVVLLGSIGYLVYRKKAKAS